MVMQCLIITNKGSLHYFILSANGMCLTDHLKSIKLNNFNVVEKCITRKDVILGRFNRFTYKNKIEFFNIWSYKNSRVQNNLITFNITRIKQIAVQIPWDYHNTLTLFFWKITRVASSMNGIRVLDNIKEHISAIIISPNK